MKEFNQKIKIFGRKKGRKNKKNLNLDILKKYTFTQSTNFFEKKIILDIGSGNGENTLFLSQKYPNDMIIASDIYLDGNINLSKKLFNYKIDNVKIFDQNVLILFDRLNFKNFIKEIWILFPDPWPKAKHYKRRLVNYDFLNKVGFMLQENGKIYIATDSSSYLSSILLSFYNSKLFRWINDLPNKWDYNLNTFCISSLESL